MLPHLTPGHTHPPPTISPLPLNRCCSIAVWSSECLPAQALCQSHPPQWPSLVLQMGLISDSQRQNAQRSSPQHSILRLLSGDTSPSLRSAPGNTHGIDDVFKTNSLHRQRRRSRMAKAQCGQNWIHFQGLIFYSLACCFLVILCFSQTDTSEFSFKTKSDDIIFYLTTQPEVLKCDYYYEYKP